jgi:Transcription elongation factor, GreA/GreB, C-term
LPDILTVDPGFLIQVELAHEEGTERLEFVIVPDEQADFSAGFLGASTPLAQAILGKPVDSTVPYAVGDARSVCVLSISKTDKNPPQDTAARREESLRRAVEQSDKTNAMIFASSFSGKWGDYDPEGIETWDKDKGKDKEEGS